MIRKKITLTLGGVIAVTLPIVAIVSCGDPKQNEKTDAEKFDGITKTMVINALTKELDPSATTYIPATTLAPFKATLNGLENVNIKIDIRTQDDANGIVTMDVHISTLGLLNKKDFQNIVMKGFKKNSDQNKMDNITKEMVIDALIKQLDPPKIEAPATKPHTFKTTLNRLDDVKITFTGWSNNVNAGTIKTGVQVFKDTLTPHAEFIDITISEFKRTDAEKFDGINKAMVTDALTKELDPSATTDIPKTTPPPFKATLNGLDNVNIKITVWAPWYINGSVTMDVQISTLGLLNKKNFQDIVMKGFIKNADQIFMNDITKLMVTDVLVSKFPTDSSIPKTAPAPFTATLNGLDNVLITLSKWKVGDSHRMVTMTAAISKKGLTSPGDFPDIIISGFTVHLDWNHVNAPTTLNDSSGAASSSVKINPTTLLVGANNIGFYKVDITDPNAWKWVLLDLSAYGLDNSSGNASSLILANKNTLLVGTRNEGFWKVNITDPTSWVWTREHETGFTDSSAYYSLSLLADKNTLLVGTQDKGFWKVNITDPTGWVWTREHETGFTDASAFAAQAAKVNKNTLLVGTQDKGFWKINITDPTGWVWTREHETGFTGASAWDSPIIKVNENILLVGTRDKGFWKVNITDPTGWVWTREHETGFTDASGKDSRLVKINPTTLLVGTFDKGFWKVNITDPTGWVWTKEHETGFSDYSGIKASWVQVNENTLLVGTNDKGFFIINY